MALGWKGQYYRYREFFLNISSFYKQRADLRAFLEIILSLTTIIIFLLFALKPTVLTIISLLQEINTKQSTIVTLDQKIKDLDTAQTVFTQNQASIADVDVAIGTNPQPDLILQQIEGLANKDSVTLLGASVGQIILVGTTPAKKSSTDIKPLPNGANEMPISISIKGDYPSLIAFMTDFENLRLVTKIDTFTINSTVSDKGQSIVAVVSGRVPFIGQ